MATRYVAANSFAVVDADNVTSTTSLALDASENPVIGYYDSATQDLQLAHCNDRDCAGGDESIATVDSTGQVGSNASLAVDAAGLPVIAYYDESNGHLKIAHCNDANCASGDESIVTVDSADSVGVYTSLLLDANGNPVVSYYDYGNSDLKLAHCNDAYCAGGDESIVTVDGAGDVGSETSLALDAAGNPVISYQDSGSYDLKLAHCNEPNCAGGDESIVTVDTAGRVGGTSLTLDATGNPVVSYHDFETHQLKLAHCNDPNCVGDDERIVTVDGSAGFASLELDVVGNPVVSYQDGTRASLKVAHCNDPNCGGGDESIVAVDSAGSVGHDTSLRLNHNGHPVISYRDWANEDLKLARCDNTICSPVTCIGAGATIIGTAGDDVLHGTPGVDVIAAGDGDDTVDALAGNDRVCGGDGSDTINGGDGDDELYGFSDGHGDLGDMITGDAGNDFLDGGTADDQLQGGPGNDVLLGGDEPVGDDVLDGGPGDDHLSGEGGLDTASYSSSVTAVSANLTAGTATGDGTDALGSIENLIGSPFADTLVGDDGPNVIHGLDGDDVLDGAAGVDTVSYEVAVMGVTANLANGMATGDGTDHLTGFENLTGSPFGDNLDGNGGANTLRGLGGTDALDGAAGDDRLDSGPDGDVIFGSVGDDVINGGAGSDTLNFARSPAGVTANLSTGTVSGEGSDRVVGMEHLGGSRFADVLTGNGASNSIAGGEGNDVISGSAGVDAAFGDEGADTIRAGAGDDLVAGGSGNDVIAGGFGNDHLSGESGIDTVTYAEASASVSVSLGTHRASGDGSDLLFGFENATGRVSPTCSVETARPTRSSVVSGTTRWRDAAAAMPSTEDPAATP